MLFEDKWPEDWRGKLIDILEKGRPESAGNTPNGVSAEKSHEKHKIEAFRGGEKTGNDDDDHYSKYGITYDTYKKSHSESIHGHSGTSKSSSSSSDPLQINQ